MGEYWKPVNVTRKEYVHAHRVDEGLKLAEWTWRGSAVLTIVGTWLPTDDIRIVSDYEGDIRVTPASRDSKEEVSYELLGESPDYTGIESAPDTEQHPETIALIINAASREVDYYDWREEWKDVLQT